MIELIELLNNFGFPVVVAIILLYDKLKSNGQLKKAVENNTLITEQVYQWIKENYGTKAQNQISS